MGPSAAGPHCECTKVAIYAGFAKNIGKKLGADCKLDFICYLCATISTN